MSLEDCSGSVKVLLRGSLSCSEALVDIVDGKVQVFFRPSIIVFSFELGVVDREALYDVIDLLGVPVPPV